MFVKMSLRDRLICFADFVGMTLFALRFLLPPVRLRLPPPNYFLKVSLPTLFAAVLIFFLPLTNSAIHGTAKSKHLSVLQLGRYIEAKMKLQFSQYLVQVHRILVPVVDQHLYRTESLLVLKQTPCNVF